MLKICEYCNKEFKTYNSKRKFCCRKCSSNSVIINKPKKCLYCDSIFISAHKLARYCSNDCKHKAKKGIKIKNTCSFCGNTVNTGKRYCSQSCYIQDKVIKHNLFYLSVETSCECGCGQIIKNPTRDGYYRRFIPGHALIGKKHGPTSIEKELYSYLEKVGILFEKQKQIGKTRPDAFIPSLNLCIYADGQHWHNQEKNIKSDRRCESYLTKNGYLWLRLLDNNKRKLNLKPLTQYLLQNIKYIF